MLKLVKIKKNYEVAKEIIPALNGIDLEFRKNEFVAILGPSGCGKTTLLNIIGGLDKYSDGDLIINGKSTKDYTDRDWDSYRNHSIGFVFQTYNLIPHLNVLENVELALTLSGISKEEREKMAINALERVGIKDKANKKPNQLSGGQMQRVAIARAIVNNPEIILADEPTGALDSKTSVQIMDILKELAKDKLVIMVTHNPELAKEYSNRTITLLDGIVTSDSNSFISKEKNTPAEVSKKKKPAMNFITALSLSLKNLFTKKTRTILTAIAGSIGIIGIALVLALSNGFQKYIDKMQADTLASYPLTIEEKSLNVTDISNALSSLDKNLDKYPNVKEVYVNEVLHLYDSLYSQNEITNEYIENVIEKIDPNLINGINYKRDVEINLFTNRGPMKQVANGKDMHVKLTTNMVWYSLLDNEDFIKSQYDVLQGRLPSAKNEIVIVVDKYNQLMDATLLALGLYEQGQNKKKFTFDELMSLEFKLLTNDEMYLYSNDVYSLNGVKISGTPMVTKEAYDAGLTLKVVGIIRPNEKTTLSFMTTGVAYLPSMIDYILEKNSTSSLANYLRLNPETDPFTGEKYIVSSADETIEDIYNSNLKRFGVDSTPKKIEIYPKDFNSKEKIKNYLQKYNEGVSDKEKVTYTDLMDLVITTIETLINGISYILIAFSSISLIVSSIMIAIITYVSVIERTKEIGVLRSIGARKKDISRVFNAETFIIGFSAGLFGVCVTAILTIPINIIINSFVEGIGNIAILSFTHAILLVLVSVSLTIISGFIPAKIASKKDPVIALRSDS